MQLLFRHFSRCLLFPTSTVAASGRPHKYFPDSRVTSSGQIEGNSVFGLLGLSEASPCSSAIVNHGTGQRVNDIGTRNDRLINASKITSCLGSKIENPGRGCAACT